ncbi:hypothetical protein [Aeromonas eucrenophila]|uniref:Uncharacterized protein n=1 Tax=Aeromonas eucrenophila TaxID=649 RepID=A0ABW0YCQ9_9GAMM|nr:hypothetical protein [Aeromonas eucrenophila]
MANPDRNLSDGVSPQAEGTPRRNTENGQIQWLVESVSSLKASQDTLTVEVKSNKDHFSTQLDHKLELLNVTTAQKNDAIAAKLTHVDERLAERHKTLEDKINSHHQLMMAKLEAMEHKVGKAHSDTRFDTMKWVIGMMVGFPSIAWAAVQIVKAFAK